MIPARCHFVWLGPTFPWLNALAVLSAAKAGGFESIVLYTDHDLCDSPNLASLRRLSGFDIRRVELGSLAHGAGESTTRVRALYESMTSAAARSDVLRALILAGEGGVYLDLDTVTLATFAPLRSLHAFVGQEIICFPEWSTRQHSVREITRAYGLSALRLALRALPQGYHLFARVQHLYSLAVNNAVMGTEASHPFIHAYLRAMLRLPPEVAKRRFAIGPDLLARVCREETGALELLPPGFFYPLGPVMAQHWWSCSRSPDVDRVLSRDTVSVHWYASVRGRKRCERVNAAYVERHQSRELFSKLASRYLEHF